MALFLMMKADFWSRVAILYEFFEYVYNGRVNRRLCKEMEKLIANGDSVLECACGTGMLSRAMARKAGTLTATDYADGMLRQARLKCRHFSNIQIFKADINALPYTDCRFDKVVAGNVIHLLDHPEKAMAELMRVCKPGGQVIVPTYVNNENTGSESRFVRLLQKMGAGFKCQFDYPSYQRFMADMGYEATFSIVRGKMPCAIAVIEKKK